MKSWSPNLLPRELPGHSHRVRLLNPPKALILGFITLILSGTLLLKTPWASHGAISWLDALFTATSAVTVTGLVVVDTGTHFSLFGQLIILLLIQLGGIGFMTFAVLMAAALDFKLSLRQQLVAQTAFNQPAFNTIKKSAISIAIFSLIVEAVGTVLLSIFFIPELGWLQGFYHSIFYAVSAFNNAGFALSSNNLSAYVGSWGISLTVSALFIFGGLGYLVFSDIVQKRRYRTLSVYTRLMLWMTLIVNVTAFILFLIFEYHNPASLGGLTHWGDKLLAAWFQATSPRTAGFNTLDISGFTTATCVLFLLLMFIGAAPNSTASGIKLSTFVVMLAATKSFLTGNLHVTLGRHSLSPAVVTRALAIATISMMTIFLAILGLSAIETTPLLNIAFEVVSAFGTVGLSRGITDQLSSFSLIIIIFVMLIGRVGPLTLGYLLTIPKKHHIRFAHAELPVG